MPSSRSSSQASRPSKRSRQPQSAHRSQPSAPSTNRSRPSQSLRQRTLPWASTSSSPHPPSTAASVRSATPSIPSRRRETAEDLDDDILQEIIMAINVKDRQTVGCAYYVAREEKLYCMQDVKMGGFDVVDNLRTFVAPTVLLIPFTLDEKITDLLEGKHDRREEGDDSDDQNLSLPYQLDFRVSGDWKYESGRQKLTNLSTRGSDASSYAFMVPGDDLGLDELEDPDDRSAGQIGQLLSLGSSIDLDSQVSIGCAGAVLGYLYRRRNAAHLPGDEGAQAMFRASAVESFSLDGYMSIDVDTLLSLQVIQAESHPNSQNRGPQTSGSKEGLSLYGLFHHLARTPQGRTLLRQWFLRPLMDLDTINGRLGTVGVLTKPDNLPMTDTLISHLKKIKNMQNVFVNLHKGSNGGILGTRRATGVSRTIWSGIRTFVYNAIKIKSTLMGMSGASQTSILAKIRDCFDDDALGGAGELISSTIDDELSLHAQRTVVKQGVDATLDGMKQLHGGMDDLLTHVALSIAQQIPMLYNAQPQVIFFPQMGFLIAVRRISEEPRGVYEGSEDDPWDKSFYSNDHVYYKSGNMREMDEKFGDVYSEICDREIEIIEELTEKILQYEHVVLKVSDICGELDCLTALAQGAREYNLVRPRMTEDNVLDIRGGRHLLQERTVSDFIANDTLLVGGHGDSQPHDRSSRQGTTSQSQLRTTPGPSMLMITGPNYSGKSVYLKQVALITLLAHVGSFIPAEKATIGLTDKILTRIRTRESVSKMQSALMIDLQQMSSALTRATRRSLIIVDEFGKGTESYDGAGLAAGVFEDLLSRGNDCPKVVAATHFHELFENNHLPPHCSLAFFNMQIHIPNPINSLTNPTARPHSAVSTSTSYSRTSTPTPSTTSTKTEIVHLYTLVPGRTSSSYGTICARMNGVRPDIVAHAERLIELDARGEDLVAACAELSAREVEDLREAEDVARRFLAVTSFGEEEGGDGGGGEEVKDARGMLREVLGLMRTVEVEA